MVQRKTGAKTTTATRAVIFDFDGTIADSFEYVFDFLRAEARNTRTYSAAERQALRKMSMKRLALHLGVPLWRLLGVYFRGRREMREHMEHVQPFAGMEQTIRDLHAAGYMLLIASANSTSNLRKFLARTELSDCFRAVRGGAGFTGKASLIRQLMVRYRLSKYNTCSVGDETSDVVAAAAAGIACVAVGWGFADPEKLHQLKPAGFANKPNDIPACIEAIWKK